ncbi:MAG: AAA family ATPase [Myxococcota bacterium]
MALIGGPGTGKTYSALRIASHLGEKICVIDVEHGRASLYADEFNFDTAVLPDTHPKTYVRYLLAAQAAEYDVIILDGITPEWDGPSGCLSLVDEIQRRGADKLRAWGQITPLHDNFIQHLIRCPAHLICTVRGRQRRVVEKDSEGRQRVVMLSMGPIQQDKVLYCFPIIGEMDSTHNMHVSKSACHTLKGAVIQEPGEELARILLEWMAPPEAPTKRRYFSDAEVRAAMGVASRTGAWEMQQIGRLMNSLSAQSVEELGEAQRRKLVNALQSSTGDDWCAYNLSDAAK